MSQECAAGARQPPSPAEHESFCSRPHHRLSATACAVAQRDAPVDGGRAGHLGTRLHVVAPAHAERGRVRLLPALDAVHLPSGRMPPLHPRAPTLTRDTPVLGVACAPVLIRHAGTRCNIPKRFDMYTDLLAQLPAPSSSTAALCHLDDTRPKQQGVHILLILETAGQACLEGGPRGRLERADEAPVAAVGREERQGGQTRCAGLLRLHHRVRRGLGLALLVQGSLLRMQGRLLECACFRNGAGAEVHTDAVSPAREP